MQKMLSLSNLATRGTSVYVVLHLIQVTPNKNHVTVIFRALARAKKIDPEQTTQLEEPLMKVYIVCPLALYFSTLFMYMYGVVVSEQLWNQMSLVVRKPVFGVSDQVSHKQGCTATGDG